TIIHDDVTLGHRAVVHGAEVKSGALIGIGAIVLDKCVIGEGALVGAMSLVAPGTIVPPGALVMGQPARVVRDVRDAERAWMRETILNYASLAKDYSRKGP
ncbi:MAG TPA: gamma carbonic anhydrase family protein, partial [Candidatus Binatia bacterium]|nr:gamma carbonic anhydrase family protein [Candidatus Binatia bacterium]